MTTTFFRDPEVVSDLLAACQEECWISSKLAQKARVLIEHGLHPEQALIGTGLVTPDQYGDALTHIFDLPFVRGISSGARRGARNQVIPHLMLEQAQAQFIDQDISQIFVAFIDPSDVEAVRTVGKAAQAKGLELVPVVTLWSDIRSTQPAFEARSSVASVRRALHQALTQASTHTLELGSDHHAWHTSHKSIQALPKGFTAVPVSAAQALALHVKRHEQDQFKGWTIEPRITSHGTFLHLNRSVSMESVHHPLEWSNELQRFLKNPVGVIILMQATDEDGMLPQALSEWRQKNQGTHWRELPKLPHIYNVQEEKTQEEAIHAALSGRPVVALQTNEDLAWLEPLQATHTPISLLKQHPVPEGMAWSAYSV